MPRTRDKEERLEGVPVFVITDGDDFYDVFTSEDEAGYHIDDVAKQEGIPVEQLRVDVLIAKPEPGTE